MAGLLKRALQEEGHAVDVAADGREGLWLATENTYGAIVLDVMLPGLDGIGVCRRLVHARRLHRRENREPYLRRSLHRPHRARRSRRGRIRSRGNFLRQAIKRFLGEPRPHPSRPPRPGLGIAIPHRDFLSFARTGSGSQSLERKTGKIRPLQKADRHPNRPRGDVLSRRGLSPAVSGKTRPGDVSYQVAGRGEQVARQLPATSSREQYRLALGDHQRVLVVR